MMVLWSNFNPRAPCGARPIAGSISNSTWKFQSTRPMRGATTCTGKHSIDFNQFQSTRPMRGATNFTRTCMGHTGDFNPRAPCGARLQGLRRNVSECGFQSTRPMRGATRRDADLLHGWHISIHAPHAGRDVVLGAWQRAFGYFNPRAPCGARRGFHQIDGFSLGFQSTRPMRGATFLQLLLIHRVRISIHAPHAGRDSKSIQNYFTHFCDKRQFLDNFTQNAAF